MNKFLVGKSIDFVDGTKKRVMAGDLALMLIKVEGKLYATADACSHNKASLSGGKIDGFCIECPWHGAKFDVRDGKVMALPAAVPIKTYKVAIEGVEIWVEI